MPAPSMLSVTERLAGRELRASEKVIDVLGMTAELDAAKDELELAIIESQVIVAAARARGRAARLAVDDRMRAALVGLFRAGRAHAFRELRLLGYTTRELADAPTPDELAKVSVAIDMLEAKLGALSIKLNAKHVAVSIEGATQDALVKALRKVLGARAAAADVVSTAMFAGMGQVFEDHADLVPCWEYTAVLDAGTCDVCESFEGLRFFSLEDLFAALPNFGPNPICLGGSRCRCRAVPCPAGTLEGLPENRDLPEWVEKHAARQRIEDRFAKVERGPMVVDSNHRLRGRAVIEEGWISEPPRGNEAHGLSAGPRLQEQYDIVQDIGRLVDDEVRERLSAEIGDLTTRLPAFEQELAAAREASHAAREAGWTRELYAKYDLAAANLSKQDYSDLIGRIESAISERLTITDAMYEGGTPKRVVDQIRLAIADGKLQSAIVNHGGLSDALAAIRQQSIDDLAQLKLAEDAAEASLRQAQSIFYGARRRHVRDVVAELRPAAGHSGDFGGTFDVGRGRRTYLADLEEWVPKEWIDHSNVQGPLQAVKAKDGGGFYRHLDKIGSDGRQIGKIHTSNAYQSRVLGDSAFFDVTSHELGHRLERVVPGIGELEFALHDLRSRGGKWGGALEETYKVGNGGTGRGRYPDRYSGRIYEKGFSNAYELLSMALENLLAGNANSNALDDVAYRWWLYGVLTLF